MNNTDHHNKPSTNHPNQKGGSPVLDPKNPKTRPMRLPFEPRRRRGGWAEWVFRHRIGLMVTVVVYLSLMILFVTYRIVVVPAPLASIEIEFSPEELKQIEQIIEKKEQIEKLENRSYEKMQNKISDENSKYNTSLRDHKNTNASQIYEEAQRVSDRVNAGRDSYNRSLSEIENGSKPRPSSDAGTTQTKTKSGNENRDAFVRGNVAASYNLEGRTVEHIDIPAYKCEGGGQVVVMISVNQNGKVVAASVDRSTSVDDHCIMSEAVASAKATRFNASSSAPNPQHGTITFSFVAQ